METVHVWLSIFLAEISCCFNNISHHIGTMLIIMLPTLGASVQQSLLKKKQKQHHHFPPSPLPRHPKQFKKRNNKLNNQNPLL